MKAFKIISWSNYTLYSMHLISWVWVTTVRGRCTITDGCHLISYAGFIFFCGVPSIIFGKMEVKKKKLTFSWFILKIRNYRPVYVPVKILFISEVMESPPSFSTHSEAPPLSEDSGLLITSGSFSSDSASGWHHVASEVSWTTKMYLL